MTEFLSGLVVDLDLIVDVAQIIGYGAMVWALLRRGKVEK